MPLTQMLLVSFGLAGFVNPGFWLLGLAATVAFVGGRSSSERFQKLIEAERLAARAGSAEDPGEGRLRAAGAGVAGPLPGVGGGLPRDSRPRDGRGESGLTDFRAGNLNQMLSLFLRLLASREAITDTLARVDRRQLETGLETLKARVASAGDPEGALARSLRATLEIQEKRLANLETATTNVAVVDAELERIEQQVRLVREESAVSRSPEALSARLDAVSRTLGETSRFLDQHAEIFSDSVTDFETGSVPPLPREPEEEAEEQRPIPPRPRVGQRQR